MNSVIQAPNAGSPQSAVKGGIDIRPVLLEQASVSPEQLIPYGEAAKAIFMRVNGVALATGKSGLSGGQTRAPHLLHDQESST